jgi:hypothetical protein
MGMTIRAGTADGDGLVGVEIRVWSDRYTGSAFLWSDATQLSDFASSIAGFPARAGDRRHFAFGSRDSGVTPGYCGLLFRTTNSAGHAVVDVVVEDGTYRRGDGRWETSPAKAEFSIPVEASDIDRFVAALRAMEAGDADEAGW